MKRILICATNYLPHVGGAEIAVHEITQRLACLGYLFDVITARIDRKLPWKEKMGGVTIYRVGFGGVADKFLLPVFGYIMYVSLSRHHQYDILWSIMASHASVLASFISFVSRIPLVLTLQEGDEEEHLLRYVGGSRMLYRWLIKPWHTLVFKRVKRVTAISQYLKKRAERYTRVPIDIVPNGVDLEKFTDTRDDVVREIRKQYNLEDKYVIVSVSRLVTKNNVSVLIRALTHLPQEVVLFIVGDGEERNALELLVRARALEKRVIFAGRVSPNMVPAYMQVGNVFARVPFSEGMGNVFIEAMAVGVPVVASPVGGIIDIVEHEKTGLLISPHDEQTVAQAIERVRTDRAFAKKLVEHGKEHVRQYSWERCAEDMKRVFERLL